MTEKRSRTQTEVRYLFTLSKPVPKHAMIKEAFTWCFKGLQQPTQRREFTGNDQLPGAESDVLFLRGAKVGFSRMYAKDGF